MNSNVKKINDYNILGVILQVIFTLASFILTIVSLLVSEKCFSFLEIVVGFDLLIMAYNNGKIYKRKNMTIIYVVFGICLIIYGILNFLEVI